MRMIRGEENISVEYKQSVAAVEQDDFVALANANGGTILVGVEEVRQAGRQYGRVVGCDVGEAARRGLLNKAASCLPSIGASITVEGSRARRILRVDVQEALRKPCCTASGTYKIRMDGTKVAIDPTLLTTMILERESEEFLRRFRVAGEAILAAVAQAQTSLQTEIGRVRKSADDAVQAAHEATEAAESAEAAADIAATEAAG
jgi:ATP-dependent DNA helicase RecG